MQAVTPRFTNEVSDEYLQSLSRDLPDNPARAIFRFATEGCRTRQGGTLRQASSGWHITLDNGMTVGVGLAGDHIEYPDGSSAQILPDAYEKSGDIALVGSRLSNGDEIIDTLQDLACIVVYEGLPTIRISKTEG